MPRLPQPPTFTQETLQLYPAVAELDASRGVIATPVDELGGLDPAKRVTLARLAGLHGRYISPLDDVSETHDAPLELLPEDFANGSVENIQNGLIIYSWDDRLRHPGLEQFIRIHGRGNWGMPGVVFPSNEFKTVARSPRDLAAHTMAQTREANKDNTAESDEEIEAKVGRSAGHAILGKMTEMKKLDDAMELKRATLLMPLMREAHSNLTRHWQAHYLPKNIDALRKQYDEELHDTIETAAINADVSRAVLNATHRAVTSNLYRRGSSRELAQNWVAYLRMSREYIQARRREIAASGKLCTQELQLYQQFLDAPTRNAA